MALVSAREEGLRDEGMSERIHSRPSAGCLSGDQSGSCFVLNCPVSGLLSPDVNVMLSVDQVEAILLSACDCYYSHIL